MISSKPASKNHTKILYLVLAALVLLVLCLHSYFNLFAVRGFVYKDAKKTLFKVLPWSAESSPGRYSAQVFISLPVYVPALWRIVADDCINNLVINDINVDSALFPICKLNNGEQLDLKPYLKPGLNKLSLEIENFGGPIGFNIVPSGLDKTNLAIRLSPILFLISLVLFLTFRLGLRIETIITFSCFALGVLLRVNYLLNTPFQERAYDADGHAKMLRAILGGNLLPDPGQCWECHQAPLYYWIAALWMKFGSEIFGDSLQRVFFAQILSLIVSIVILLAGLWLGKIILKERLVVFSLYSGLIAVWPSLVFHSNRISNEGFSLALALISLCLFWNWKVSLRFSQLATSTIFLALSCIAKASAGVLGVYYCITALIDHKLNLKKKSLVFSAVFLAAIPSLVWLIFHLYPYTGSLDPNYKAQTLNSLLKVSNDIYSFLTFNPIRVVSLPYNAPWGPNEQRAYVLEYMFRSALFGEFNLGLTIRPVAQILLSCSLVLLANVILFFCLAYKTKTKHLLSFDLTLLIILHLIVVLTSRIANPFSCMQDFRYISIVLFPALAIGLLSINSAPVFLRAGLLAIQVIGLISSLIISIYLGFTFNSLMN